MAGLGLRDDRGKDRCFARKLFRVGPVLLLPLIILWGQLCFRIGTSEAYDWWRSYPIFIAVGVAFIWHVALLVVEKDRLHYSMYLIGHFPILAYTAFISGVYATRAPL